MSSLLVGYAVQKVDTDGDVLAKLVLLILADYANSEGKAWPALETLVKETGRSLASVKRARAKLVDLGLIVESGDQGYTLKYRGDQRPKVYDILPMVDMPERPARIVEPVRKAVREVPPERNLQPDNDGSPMSPRQIDDGSPMHTTTAHGCTERRLTHEPQTVNVNNKLFTNRQSEPLRASAHGPTDENTPHEPDDESTPAPTPESSPGIDTWAPNEESLALADELQADVDSEAGRFRMRVRDSGDVPRDPDAAFRKWLRQGASYGILVTRQPRRQSDHRPQPKSSVHVHRWDCEHVVELMAPHEHEYDHERLGFAPSEWMLACQAAAGELNRQEASGERGMSHITPPRQGADNAQA